MSISVKNVFKYYGEQAALNDVSFSINSGEIVGFLGPNGAGKSTMMKIITCYLTKSSGTVKVCGLDVEEDSIKIRQKVGYLPEHNPLYLDMYVKEYLTFVAGLYNSKADKEQKIDKKTRVAEMVQLVGLEKEQHKKIGALSKGYRQRVGIAQAMIHDPEVLILDEPTSGLDPNQLVDIRKLIQNIGKTKTVMLSTHIMQEVEAICDRVIIIKDGSIVADDTKSKMQKDGNNYQVVFVEFDIEFSRNKLKLIEGVGSVKNVQGNTWLIQATGEKDIRPAISKFAQQNGLLVLTQRIEEKTMEEVFKSLTKN
ncbi:gliding motility-associated ABC transporter ATP-binding subunit GldA [Putridiphycobacter roseus]|uniref:Gliding motility-associated ABC transporter ATP-binding subunit GldA n=1 Tax=Putridiphycobacter roseus TaxID=2219161 RepID=A0A2W1NQU2_9FLAO|nr:gliding motility-associated ABC transporter ATP-binding subunit GldA [Putridiphycobacter roseus]PZE17038.1 gliding motility-associated ABC transporter ATP-binding subunit GldA [Putridiphycobacter roseus]